MKTYYMLCCSGRKIGAIESEQPISQSHWASVIRSYYEYLLSHLASAAKPTHNQTRREQLSKIAPPVPLFEFALARLGAKPASGDVFDACLELPYGIPAVWMTAIFSNTTAAKLDTQPSPSVLAVDLGDYSTLDEDMEMEAEDSMDELFEDPS